jgi:hypothetical protein
MAGNASAFAALGLEPGADPAAIEAAYKRLIKRYHPDREGGDSKRAAEINRAYRELRGAEARDHLIFNDEDELPAGRIRVTWAGTALAAAAAVLVLALAAGPLSRLTAGSVPRLPIGHSAGTATASDPMDQPLAAIAVDRAVGDAVRLVRTSDEMKLAATSRDCHHQLRLKPDLSQLDRCAAFDDAVVQLQDRDPLRDQGPFSELAVTGRQWSGASALSSDYLAIDSRLDRIRLRVELALAPAPAPIPSEDQLALGDNRS